jgi:hypothetical protein
MPSETSGEGGTPMTNFFSSMRPPKGTSLSKIASFEVSSVEIDRRVPEEGRHRKWKNEETGKDKTCKLHHIEQANLSRRVL